MISFRAALFGPVDRPEPEPSELTDASSRTVLRQVIALLLLACAPPLVSEALIVGYMFFWGQFAIAAVVFLWLSWLVIARTPLSPSLSALGETSRFVGLA